MRRALQGLALDLTPIRESRDLGLLFGGQAINTIGMQVRIVTVPYMVYLQTHSSLMVGLLSLAQFLPSLVFSIVGGALADSMDRRRLLLITQVLLAVCAVALAIAALLGTPALWSIFFVVMLSAGIGAIDAPTRRAALARLVSREQAANGLALNAIISQLGGVLGPAIAGLVLAGFGVGAALLIYAVSFAPSVLSLLLMAPMPPLAGADGPPKPTIAAMFEGFAFLKGKPVLQSNFLIDVNAMLFGGPTALFPALATDVFKTGPAGLGLLYAAPAVGAAAAGLCSGWVGRVRHQGRAVVIAVSVWGAAIAAFGLLAHAFWLALVFLAIAYAADQYSAIFRGTILQLAVPDRLRGRLSAVHFLVVTSGPQFGNFEAGTVAALTTTGFSVVSGGVAALIGATIIGLAIPAYRHYNIQDATAIEITTV